MVLRNLENQFRGFLCTPQIFSKNDILEYPLFHTNAEVSSPLLLNLKEPSTGVLGKRMEHFFSYYIRNFTEFEVLAENRQVIQDNLTLGEIDFLLKNSNSQEITHVELVYKFYLYDPASGNSEIERWIGPNRRDSLRRKLDRLKKRQFPLLYSEAAKPLLEQLSISVQEITQKACFKANLFVPLSGKKLKFQKINPQAVQGFYLPKREFTPDRFGNSLFFSPPKPLWPILPEFNTTWFSYSEISEQIFPFLNEQRSPLLWMKTSEGKFGRFFVVWW